MTLGKSTLLHLLLNEVNFSSGNVSIGGNVSYAPQEAWLFPSTIRNNITFGDHYDEERYSKVIQVCALTKDIDKLPNNDEYKVGEKSVSLSGGQRSRINLARAIYRKADIYLLDDPLSSIDTYTSKQIFDKCFLDHLKGKTRVLVTHNVPLLKKVDFIIIVNNVKAAQN